MRNHRLFLFALCCALALGGCAPSGGGEAPPAPVPQEERAMAPNPHSAETTALAAAALEEAGLLTEDLPLDEPVSRARFISLAVGALGAELPEAETSIPGETWYAPYVKAGYAMGLFADSRTDMSFTPTDGFFMGGRGYADMERPIRRYDAAAIAAHAAPPAETETVFADGEEIAALPELLQKELQAAAAFLPPLEDGSFRGEELLSGGEALVCVQRLAESGRVNPSAPESPSPEPEEVLKEDRRIVHAGGYITSPAGKGRTYTNSAEALVNAYRAGNRVVELDFMWTSDGYLAGTHDWLSAVSPAIADGVPLSLAEWLETEVYEEFTPLCLESLAGFMREHPDLYVVTDVKVRNADAAAVIAKTCPDLKERFLIQIYQDGEYDPVAALGFPHIIYTLYNLPPEDKRDTEHLAAFAAEHPLLGYTYPDALRDVWRYTARMKNTGVLLFVHTINDREEIAACYTEGITAVYTDTVW